MASHREEATRDDPTRQAGGSHSGRLAMLDGWRAISILLVLAGHMLPLGPKSWAWNGPVAAMGMAVFFTLSGFLIVSILLRNPHVGDFLIRRLARIVPLAWPVLALYLVLTDAPAPVLLHNLLFIANNPPFYLFGHAGHFWSLDVEMQFYVAIAAAVLLLGPWGVFLVPAGAAAVTLARIWAGQTMTVVTWFRVDEILAGGVLALLVHAGPRRQGWKLLAATPFWPIVIMFVLSTRPELPALNYVRPYLAAMMVGRTIVRPVRWASPLLETRPLAYVARISYALYVFHPFTVTGWLGSGEGIAKYVKRPISFVITFGLAHVSTFFWEKRFVDWSHRITARRLFARSARLS